MSESQVIARKFRPQAFDEVIGQETITRTLKNTLTSGRIHHAYLFTGARGVGKTTTARIFAKALNCQTGITIEPCGVCPSCIDITASRSIDVIEIDAASNTGVENVRNVIINTVAIAPARDRHKIFIIDEVHQLSGPAFNALLKTLEEPPPRIIFMMATTELQKVPETILSRCQVFEFRTITLNKIVAQLRHIADNLGVEISDAALMNVARAGEGSMRDAESAFDQVISFSGNTIKDEDVSLALGLVDVETLNRTLQAISEQNAQEIVRLVDEVVSRGYDLRNFCRELMTQIRALLVIKVAGFDYELLQMPPGEGQHLSKLAEAFSEQDLVRFFSLLTKTEQDIRTSSQPRFQLEIGLVKLVQARRLYLLEDALGQLRDLQTGLAQGGGPASSPTPAGRTAARESGKSGFQSAAQKVRIPPLPVEPPPQSAPTVASESKPTRASTSVEEKRQPRAAKPEAPPRALQTSERVEEVASRLAPLQQPPSFDELPPLDYDETPHASPVVQDDPGPPASSSGSEMGKRLISALESQRKMLLVSLLDRAENIVADGDYLHIAFAAADAPNKPKLESRDYRKLIEETAREIVGRNVQMLVTVDGQPLSASSTPSPKPPAEALKQPATSHPKIKAIVEKFRGEVEIIKPEN